MGEIDPRFVVAFLNSFSDLYLRVLYLKGVLFSECRVRVWFTEMFSMVWVVLSGQMTLMESIFLVVP